MFITLMLLWACHADSDENQSRQPLDPFQQNLLLGRGINLGNALEAPAEGAWGVHLEAEYFRLISEAGFNSVRIPIRWSAHAETDSPYTIDGDFLARVDWAIQHSLDTGLAVVINIHHYEEIMSKPEEHKPRFLSLWSQIATHYMDYPDGLIFEILNEPHDVLTAGKWNDFLAEAITLIRETNPYRTLMVGTAEWGGIGALPALQIPEGDHNIIVTFHYYNPFKFTHQGAEWVEGSNAWLGTTWTAKAVQKQAVRGELGQVQEWATQANRPIFMGEFGAYSKADLTSRGLWTDFVAREAEACNMSWAYWEFCAGFGVYNPTTKVWNQTLLKALLPTVSDSD